MRWNPASHAAANSQWTPRTLFAWQPHHSVHSLDSAACLYRKVSLKSHVCVLVIAGRYLRSSEFSILGLLSWQNLRALFSIDNGREIISDLHLDLRDLSTIYLKCRVVIYLSSSIRNVP